MELDVREASTVWLVFRRKDMGQKKRGIYELMGVAAATGDRTAEQVAEAMCVDETYWIMPCPVNVALPEAPITPRGQRWPKQNTIDLRPQPEKRRAGKKEARGKDAK